MHEYFNHFNLIKKRVPEPRPHLINADELAPIKACAKQDHKYSGAPFLAIPPKMEDFIIPPYNCGQYPGYFPFYPSNAKFKHQNWNKKGNNFYIAPDAPDYFDVYKRAQLKAILSQVNPNLTPRLRKANTKEFGVQVNPKVDAVIQCSLGPKTLFYRGVKWDSPRKPFTISPLKDTLPSTPVNSVRFSRPVAIYSPVFDRRIFSLSTTADESKDDGKDEDRKTDSETEDEYDDEFCKPNEKTHDESRHEKSLIQRDKRSNFQVC